MGGKVDQVTLCANAFLEAMAEVTLAHLLLEAAAIAETKKAADTDELDHGGDDDFYAGKVAAAKFYVNFVLPGVHAKTAVIAAADRSALDIPDRGFSTVV